MHFRSWLDGGAYGSYGVASTFYTGRAPDRHLQDPRLQVRGRAHLHQQAAVRAQARARDAPAALRDGVPDRQGGRAARPRPGRHAAAQPRRALHEDRQPPDRDHDRTRRVHRPRGRGVRLAPRSAKALPPGQGHRHRVLVLSHRRGHRDLLERHAALGRGGPRRSQRAACRCSAAPPTSARARTRSWPTWWPRCSASSPRTSACTPADTDLTPVDLGSYSSRVTLMAGNAAIQAAERLRAKIFDAVARKLEVGAGAARRRATAACSWPTTRSTACRSRTRWCWARACTACSPSPARTRRPSARASTRAAASGPRPATPTPRAWSRWTWTRRPAR